jgi:hypothetical protein
MQKITFTLIPDKCQVRDEAPTSQDETYDHGQLANGWRPQERDTSQINYKLQTK